MKRFTKFISLLTAASMIFGVMSVSVFAEEVNDPDVQTISTDEDEDTAEDEETAETSASEDSDIIADETEGSEEQPEEPAEPEEQAEPEEPAETEEPADETVTAETEIPVVDEGGDVGAPAVTITQQPQDVSVNYPNPTSFHVEVDDPSKVASYQWYMEDQAHQIFELHGETATTDTLELISTDQDPASRYFYCAITDIEGNVIYSHEGELDIANKKVDKPVLFIGEYALEPGDSLNIADTKLTGSGSVSFSSDGKRIIFNDFNMTNDWFSADPICSGGLAVAFRYLRAPTADNYKIILNGENVIHNVNDPTGINSGPDLLLAITHQSGQNPSTFSIEGPGSLKFVDGNYAIISEANVVLNTGALEMVPVGTSMFGIETSGADITIGAGVSVELNSIGAAVSSGRDLILERGSKLTTNVKPFYSPVAASSSACVAFRRELKMSKAELVVNGTCDPSLFPEDVSIASFIGIRGDADATLSSENSDITVHMTAMDNPTVYTGSICGIGPLNSMSLDLRSTNLNVTLDSDNLLNATGILIEGDINITSNSSVEVNVRAINRARGIKAYTEDKTDIFRVKDSDIKVNAEVIGDDPSNCFGICTQYVCDISLSDGNVIKSTAKGGLAFTTLMGVGGSDDIEYQPGYKASHIALNRNTECVEPGLYEINRTSVTGPGSPRYDYCETFYKLGETDAPADEVVLTYIYSGTLMRNAYIDSIPDVNYTGEEVTPSPMVMMGDKVLRKGTDYEISYLNNTDVGTATIVFVGKGVYKSFTTRTFNILPNGTELTAATGGSKEFTLKWKKQATKTTGYQIQYSTSKTFADGNKTVTVSSNSTTSKKVTGLKANTTYYVRIRTYKTVSGVKYYSGWSSKLIVPAGTTISSVTKGKQKFTVKWKKQATETTGYQIQYSTSKTFKSGNKTVTVSSAKTTSKTVKKLKSKKTYYIRIRTYKTVNGIKCYSGWSAKKSVKTT